MTDRRHGRSPRLHPRRRGAGRSRVLPPVPRRPRTRPC